MSFSDYLDKTATIYRLTITTGSKKAYALIGSCLCRLEMLNAEKVQQIEGIFTKTHRIYINSTTNIQAGDKVEIDTISYIVKGVQDIRDGNDNMHHKIAIIEAS
jgi:predicted transcriptional regulator